MNEEKWEETPNEEEMENSETEVYEVHYGLMSRIIGVFIEPYKAFQHIGHKPEIWGPILFTFVVLLVSSLLTMGQMVDLTEQSTSKMLADQGMANEQIDTAVKITGYTVRFQSVIQVISITIMWLLFALLTYIIGLIMGQEANYKSTLAVVGYSSLPAVLIKQGFVATILFLSHTWTDLADFQRAAMKSSLSLHSLFGNADMQPNLQALLISIDPFLVWSVILMAIGLIYANRTKFQNALTTSIVANVLIIAITNPLTAMGLKKLSEGN